MSLFVKLFVAKFLIKVAHIKRIFVNTLIMVTAYLLISFATTFNEYETSFYLVLASSVLLGLVSSLGGTTLIGFCKGFPSEVVGYFASGTGFAGVFGSGILIVLKGATDLNDGFIFFLVAPLSLVYFLAFYWLHLTKLEYPYAEEEVAIHYD